MSKRPIIIDCDPGQDDAVALFLALASPDELELLAITTVAGNVPLTLTQRNARMMCDIAGATRTRVFAGCDRPHNCNWAYRVDADGFYALLTARLAAFGGGVTAR